MHFATGPDDSFSQSCSRRVLPIDAWCGGGWRACSRWAAVASRRGAAAGAGSAAHRGADRRRCPFRADSRRPCAADGGTVAEPRAVLCRTLTCSRAGHRSAQDLASRGSSATFVSRHAAGGTAGGSADDRFLVFAAGGFPSRSTTIQFRMVVVVELPEVFKAFSLDTVRQNGLRTRSLTFQLRAVVLGVFKVFSHNRVQLRLLLRLRNAFLSGLWSRSLFLRLVKAFKIFSQDRVHPLLLMIQLVGLELWMSLGTGFFALFPDFQKSATQPSHSGSELPPHLELMDAGAL